MGLQLSALLTEKGPQPDGPAEYRDKFREKHGRLAPAPEEGLDDAYEALRKYDNIVKAAYQLRFDGKVRRLFWEAQEKEGIRSEMADLAMSGEAIGCAQIKEIAEYLVQEAGRMDITEASKRS
jgi:hypothetical protein